MLDLYQAVLFDRCVHRSGKPSAIEEDEFYRSHAQTHRLLQLLRRLRWWA